MTGTFLRIVGSISTLNTMLSFNGIDEFNAREYLFVNEGDALNDDALGREEEPINKILYNVNLNDFVKLHEYKDPLDKDSIKDLTVSDFSEWLQKRLNFNNDVFTLDEIIDLSNNPHDAALINIVNNTTSDKQIKIIERMQTSINTVDNDEFEELRGELKFDNSCNISYDITDFDETLNMFAPENIVRDYHVQPVDKMLPVDTGFTADHTFNITGNTFHVKDSGTGNAISLNDKLFVNDEIIVNNDKFTVATISENSLDGTLDKEITDVVQDDVNWHVLRAKPIELKDYVVQKLDFMYSEGYNGNIDQLTDGCVVNIVHVEVNKAKIVILTEEGVQFDLQLTQFLNKNDVITGEDSSGNVATITVTEKVENDNQFTYSIAGHDFQKLPVTALKISPLNRGFNGVSLKKIFEKYWKENYSNINLFQSISLSTPGIPSYTSDGNESKFSLNMKSLLQNEILENDDYKKAILEVNSNKDKMFASNEEILKNQSNIALLNNTLFEDKNTNKKNLVVVENEFEKDKSNIMEKITSIKTLNDTRGNTLSNIENDIVNQKSNLLIAIQNIEATGFNIPALVLREYGIEIDVLNQTSTNAGYIDKVKEVLAEQEELYKKEKSIVMSGFPIPKTDNDDSERWGISGEYLWVNGYYADNVVIAIQYVNAVSNPDVDNSDVELKHSSLLSNDLPLPTYKWSMNETEYTVGTPIYKFIVAYKDTFRLDTAVTKDERSASRKTLIAANTSFNVPELLWTINGMDIDTNTDNTVNYLNLIRQDVIDYQEKINILINLLKEKYELLDNLTTEDVSGVTVAMSWWPVDNEPTYYDDYKMSYLKTQDLLSDSLSWTSSFYKHYHYFVENIKSNLKDSLTDGENNDIDNYIKNYLVTGESADAFYMKFQNAYIFDHEANRDKDNETLKEVLNTKTQEHAYNTGLYQNDIVEHRGFIQTYKLAIINEVEIIDKIKSDLDTQGFIPDGHTLYLESSTNVLFNVDDVDGFTKEIFKNNEVYGGFVSKK